MILRGKVFDRSLATAAILVLSATLTWGGSELDDSAVIISRAPYLQLATPTSIYVVWRTDDKIKPVVQYGRDLNHLDQSVRGHSITTRVSLGTNKADAHFLTQNTEANQKLLKLHSAPAGTFQYEAPITGLAPDTLYFYAVADGEHRLTGRDPSYHFRTHPLPGTAKPMRIWVEGDSGTGRESQYSVHGAMVQLVAEQKHPLDFFIHVGDMAYLRGKDVEFQARFFEMYEPTLRNTVCWAAMGNHEGATSKGTTGVGPYYDAYVLPTRGEAGGVASGLEAYYSFEYGRAHFICLDSHDLDRKPTGAMAKWLRADLEKASADWMVAYFHHPPYTKGSHDSDREKQLVEMRTHIMPILESAGVDLVLTGHSHIYERSMLLDGAYATPTVAENVVLDDGDGYLRGDGAYKKSAGLNPNEGAVQVVTGNGGQSLGRKGTMPVMKKIVVEHGSVILDIDGDTLTGIMLNKFGEERDQFSIIKRGQLTPRRITSPWQPPVWKKPTLPGGKDPELEPPDDFVDVIPKHSMWQYLAGSHPADAAWTKLGFDPNLWKVAQAGFGYGNKEVRTVLADMRTNYSVVYIRHEFEIEHADHIAEIGLMINYDDAFIAYLNGHEVVRKGVGKGHGKDATGIKPHDPGRFAYYPLADYEKHLKDGLNVLAIEGHNATLTSSDFVLDPYLLFED